MIKIISQSATINGMPCEFQMEVESIGDLPIEKDGLVNGAIKRLWTMPPIHLTFMGPVVESTLVKDEQ